MSTPTLSSPITQASLPDAALWLTTTALAALACAAAGIRGGLRHAASGNLRGHARAMMMPALGLCAAGAFAVWSSGRLLNPWFFGA